MIGAPPQAPAALKSLSDFAGAKSRDRAGPLMRTFYTGHIPEPLRLLRKRAISTPSLLIRGVSPNPCGAQVAFRLCRGKVPRPRRCSDEHFLVKPFSRVLVRGISPDPCACRASAPSQPRHFVTAPFRGKPAPAVPPPGVSAASMSATSRCRSAAPLVRPLRESLSDFAEAAAIPITVTRQPYVVAEQSARLGRVRRNAPLPGQKADTPSPTWAQPRHTSGGG